MGMGLLDESYFLTNRRTVMMADDFLDPLTSGGRWTFSGSDTATAVSQVAAVNGSVNLAVVNTQNKEAWIALTNADYQIQQGRPLVFEARVNYQDGNVNTAGIVLGFSSATGTAQMVATTYALKTAGFTGAIVYKVPGQTVWYAATSVGTTRILSTSTLPAGGSYDEIIRIEVRPVTSTIAEVAFFVDPAIDGGTINYLAPGNSNGSGLQQFLDPTFQRPLKTQMTYTSGVKMGVGAYLIAGDATAQSLFIDYMAAEMLR